MLIELAILVIVAILLIIVFKIIKNIFMLIINSLIGLFALLGFNYLFGTGVAINFWSVVITAIGGIIGFIAVIICHFLGIAF